MLTRTTAVTILLGVGAIATAQVPPPTAGSPAFSADLEVLVTTKALSGPVTQTTMGRFYRAKDGSERQDVGNSSVIRNAAAHSVTVLDHSTKQGRLLASAPQPSSYTPAPEGAATPERTTIALGTSQIEGYSAIGQRVTSSVVGPYESGGMTTDIWRIPELNVVVRTVNTTPGKTATQQLHNIRLGDPDASLFQVPAGYAVAPVDPTGSPVAGQLMGSPGKGK